jgi:hypothetical protein
MESVIKFFKRNSWTWMVAVTFGLYLISTKIPTSSSYSFNWLQALIATLGILIGVLAITKGALWLFFRKIHDYLYGHKCKPDTTKPEGEQQPQAAYFNQSFFDFRGLITNHKHVRLALAIFIFSLFLIVAVIIFLKMVSVAAVGEIYISN